jgi:hypothetical protein
MFSNILYFNKQIYCTVLQRLSSHAYVVKIRYKRYQLRDNVKRNRTNNGNVGIAALQTAEESGQ